MDKAGNKPELIIHAKAMIDVTRTGYETKAIELKDTSANVGAYIRNRFFHCLSVFIVVIQQTAFVLEC